VKLLLDTHAFVWFITDNSRLSAAASSHISDLANTVLISPASYWEVAIKISVGKFNLASSYEEFWKRGIQNYGFRILPIELEHTSRLLDLPFYHKDPFDRLLIAQALAEDLPVVSVDPLLEKYGLRRIW